MVQIDSRFLTGAMYAPFCRTTHAPMEEWEQDIRQMASLGYTCLHGFCEWHDVEYEKGRFDFTKVDRLVELCDQYGIKPIINIATCNGVGFYSPRWLMEEYRGVGEGLVDAQGQVVAEAEYIIPCMDDPIYSGYANRYLKAVAQHFAGDQRVAAFVLWGEPSKYSPRPDGFNICYCRHTKAKFRVWLQEKYGNIQKLNAAWGTEGPADYIDFSQVNPPTGLRRQQGGFCSYDDWSEYMEYNLAEHIRNADRIFKENGALQPTINEMHPSVGDGMDVWKLAECTDIVGISLFGKPSRFAALSLNVSSSIAKANNKSIFVVEAGGGSIKFDDPISSAASGGFTPSAAELKTSMLMRAGFGAKGIMYWCWRPRLSDIEGNDFGMCRPDGKPLKRTRELGRFAKVMESYSAVYNRSVRKSDVAIFMSQNITHIMDGDRMTLNYTNAIRGAFEMLSDLHINADFVSDKQVLKGLLKNYKVLLLPCTYILSEECAAEVAAFVKDGGTVIADYILAEKRPGGFCYTALPGGGLDAVFGIEREDVLYIAHPVLERENRLGIKVGSTVEEMILREAESVGGEYMPGYPLISKNRYGKGTAIYFATQFFGNYETRPALCMREVLQQILTEKGITAHTVLSAEDRKPQSKLVTTALYDKEDMTVLTVSNTDYETVSDTLLLPNATYESIGNDGKCTFISENGAVKATFTLDAMESVAIIKR